MSGSLKRQYLASFCAIIMMLANGACCGWTSPSFPILQSDATPLHGGPLTNEQMSWIGALMSPGGLVGTILYGWMCDKFGRRISGFTITIPHIASWIFIIIAQYPYHLLIARFLAGFAGGGTFIVVPIYISEITEPRVRGLMGSMCVLSCNIGIFLAYIVGDFLPPLVTPWVFLPLSAIFLVGFTFLPETPIFLMKNNRLEEAEKALRFYRGIPASGTTASFIKEMTSLRRTSDEKLEKPKKLEFKDFGTPVARRALTIGIGLVILNQFSGCFAMINYTATIFDKAGSTFSPNFSAIIVAFIQICGSYCSTLLVERAGRKILMVTSASGISIGLSIMAVYCYFDSIPSMDLKNINFLPLITFSAVIFLSNLGVSNLPFPIMAEIFPTNIKTAATTICMVLLNVCAFIAIKCLPTFIDLFAMHGTLTIFSTCSLLGTAFLIIYLPETKGKTFDEIRILLEK
ncbi:facilitated trehalose transporter Tret1-like [Culicoides brevitarsis]|uniref:facilitated trehalose transporter Tret1-like n=1 Tax=Culicoides brevitarsis TaxID=469753 RepID=UPI00307B4CBD